MYGITAVEGVGALTEVGRYPALRHRTTAGDDLAAQIAGRDQAFQHAQLQFQLALAGIVDGGLVGHHLRGLLDHLLRVHRILARHFRLQPGDGGHVLVRLGHRVAKEAGGRFVVQAHQHRALFHYLPFAHEYLADDAAFQVLHLLQLG